MPVTTGTGLTGYWVVSRAITEADTNATVVLIDIPAKTFVARVMLLVTEAFAGGTPSIDVGDSADGDIWIDTTDVTETTIGVYVGDGGDAAYFAGRYYPTASQITATLSASLSDGTAYVVAQFLSLKDVA